MERLEALEEAVLLLREAAAGSLVVVEGANDKRALERLGVGGLHVVVNQGLSLEVLVDRIVVQVQEGDRRQVVLLLDWDRTGGRLFARLRDGLRARVRLDADSRRRLARACHVRTLEEVPSELESLRLRAGRTWAPVPPPLRPPPQKGPTPAAEP